MRAPPAAATGEPVAGQVLAVRALGRRLEGDRRGRHPGGNDGLRHVEPGSFAPAECGADPT